MRGERIKIPIPKPKVNRDNITNRQMITDELKSVLNINMSFIPATIMAVKTKKKASPNTCLLRISAFP
jgi:hypothetical protein